MSTQHTLAELFAAYLAETAPHHKPRTRWQYQLFFPRLLQDFGNLPLDQLTPEVLRAWKDFLLRTYQTSTARRYVKMLNAPLRYGVQCGWLTANPLDQVRNPPGGRPRVRFLMPEERHRLLTACRASRNPYLYPMVVLTLSTGGRKEEIRGLRWPEVDFSCHVVRFLKTKTDHDRAVPLVGEALQLLTALAHHREPGIPWVFPSPCGRRPAQVEAPWRTARRKAGLPDFRFHDLRHTYASYLAMSGATLREIADALGHQDIQMTMVYAHLMPSHMEDVVRRMARKFLMDPPPADGEAQP